MSTVVLSIKGLTLLWLLLASPASAGQLTLYVFSSADCPHCVAQEPFLEGLAADDARVKLEVFEVRRTDQHHQDFRRMAAAHGIEPDSVPAVFVGGRAWIGDSPLIRTQIAAWVDHCLSSLACADSAALERDMATRSPPPRPTAIDVPVLGEVDLAAQSLLLGTALIAFVDGFNPCSLWVLTILLALVIHSGSRLRVLIVGLTFLSVTAAVYGLFISGVFGVLSYALYIDWIYWLVAGFALLFALVNIKDYFWFQRGLSFTISERHKPGIYRSIRGLLAPGRSPWALVTATFVMALGIALVELPCTAGFPVIWSGLVAEHRPGILVFAGLLAVYLAVYLLIELIVFLAALLTLRIRRFEEGHGRVLKLVGGTIMLALALMLLLDPDRMNRVDGAFAVFAGAIAAALVVIVVHRLLLPRLGIRLGSGWRES
jgi:cytochrome c biogenesis protein CcdA/glutaredoxin